MFGVDEAAEEGGEIRGTANAKAAASRAAKGDTAAATAAVAPRKREGCGCGETKVEERADGACGGGEGVRQEGG